MGDKDNNKKWFTNIQKSDTGVNIDIIPSDRVLLRASSSHTNHNVRNITDGESSTKWTSNYSVQTYKDDFYTNRQITVGDYSRGEIVNDGKNRKLFYDNQKAKETLRNKIISLKNKLNKEVESYNSQKQNTKNIPHKTQKDFMDRIERIERQRNYYNWFFGWRYKNVVVVDYIPNTTKYKQYLDEVRDNSEKRDNNNNINVKIDSLKTTFNIEEAKLRTQLNNIPNIDVNSLPVKITNDGKYIGNKQTILANNSTIKGEWIEVEIPETVVVKKYEILPGKRDGTNELTPFPKDFYVLGANDTNKWEIMDSHFDYKPVYSTDNSPISFNIKNKKKYKYLRLVISYLNPANTGFHGLGSASLSIFNVSGHRCYTINKSCETFQSYSNKENTMTKIEGLTMMDTSMKALADLKEFNKTYQKYVKCTDITIPDSIKSDCTDADKDIQTVNNVYDTLSRSLSELKEAPLNRFIDSAAYETNHNQIVQTYSEIIPLRKELDLKMKLLMDDKDNIYADNREEYDTTMYYSLVLSVVLTSSLFFIFKKL